MKKYKLKFPIKLIIIVIIFSLAIYFIIVYPGQILKKLDYFKIKDIVASDGKEKFEFSYLKGRNIFDVDLRKESRRIAELYPAYKKIRLIRILPNRLFIDFLKRKPLAFIKLSRYFCVDEDLVLFDLPEQLEEPDLPLILGLQTKIFGPQPGEEYNIKELQLALNIIKEAKRNWVLKDYKIKRIDIANASNASFFVNDALEIKITGEDIKDKINILSGVLTQEKNDLDNLEYIDLRFKEPAIKFKDVK